MFGVRRLGGVGPAVADLRVASVRLSMHASAWLSLGVESQLGTCSDSDRDSGFAFAVVEDGEDLESGAEAVKVVAQG